MTSSNKINTDELFEAYRELYSNDPAMLDLLLHEEGIDPSKIEEGVNAIKQTLFKQQVALKREKRVRLYENALGLIKANIERSREVILELLEAKNTSYAFRSLEKLETSDLEEILNESEILELMEQISKD
jgi:hypothetical protein